MLEITATEFAKRFSRYRQAAQREPIAVTHHGRATEVLMSKADYDDYLRLKRREPRALWAWEIPDDLLEAVASARVDPRHAHLDALMDET